MERFDLNDFQRKINQLLKEKEKTNKEIDKKIEALKIAQAVFRQDIDMVPGGTVVSTSETPNYTGMTTWQVLSSILKGNKGITSRELIKTAREGGLEVAEETIRSTLSRRHGKNGSVKMTKGRGKKRGKWLYSLVEEQKSEKTIKQTNLFESKYSGMSQTNVCLDILRNANKKLLLSEITKSAVKGGYSFTTDNPTISIYSALKRLKAKEKVTKTKKDGKVYYALKES